MRPRVLVLGTLSIALAGANATHAQVPAGGEFQVSEATPDEQTFPSVAADPGGAFVVVWADYASPRAIRGRRFDAAGGPRGAELQVNELSVDGPQRPIVAVDATGRTLVAWFNVAGAGVRPGIFGRLLDAAGTPTGPQLTISSEAGGYEPSAAGTPSGFVVVWLSYASAAVRGRGIDVAGNPLGAEFTVNTSTIGVPYAASVAAAESGDFVVVWASAGDAGGEVFARVFEAGGGHVKPEFKVSTFPASAVRPAVAMAGDAGFTVVWAGGSAILGRRFDIAGGPLGGEFEVSSGPIPGLYTVSAVSDKAGSFTVLWEAGPLDDHDVFGRRFTATGAPRGAAFQVNTGTIGGQLLPDVAIDGSGNLFAAWASQHQSSSHQVFGQRFGGLAAAGMSVEDGGNGVLEVAEDFALVTSWRNLSGADQTFEGRSSGVAVPAGLTLQLSGDAAYGTVANGTVGRCAPCFAGGLTGTRPAGHVDVDFVESILPDPQGQAKRWRVHVGDSFGDVPRGSPFYRYVETLLHHGITGGCAANAYCPAASATREQMAVFVLVGKEGAGYVPPACGTPAFGDMPASSPFCPWVEEVARRGAASGCGGGRFCPAVPITREQMAVLVLRTLDPRLDPPACATPMFDDVPASSPFCRWIEELARRGAVSRCGVRLYCPLAPVTRQQMALFITGAFGLTLYGPQVGHVPLDERVRTGVQSR